MPGRGDYVPDFCETFSVLIKNKSVWFCAGGADYDGVITMQYEDPKMQAYYDALPGKVRAFIDNAGVDISTPGELMLIGEHFRKKFGEDDRPGKGSR